MPAEPRDLASRIRGAILGQAVADAIGGRFEAQSTEHIRGRFPTSSAFCHYPTDELWYTDDTQMMIGVAETLAAAGTIDETLLCQRFVANYVPSRGYGRGARRILEAIEAGEDARTVAERVFPGGSYGNGAAMRVAPVGLLFHGDHERVRTEARRSALPTHLHPLGIEGAELIALAVAIAVRLEVFDRDAFLAPLIAQAESPLYRDKLARIGTLASADDLAELGSGIEAQESVATAIGCFALHPESYVDTIYAAVRLGGDTDTIAAMAGAISGAYLGARALPPNWLALLENGPQGRQFLERLATELWERAQ